MEGANVLILTRHKACREVKKGIWDGGGHELVRACRFHHQRGLAMIHSPYHGCSCKIVDVMMHLLFACNWKTLKFQSCT